MREKVLKFVIATFTSSVVLLFGVLTVPLLAEYHGLSQFWITNMLYEIIAMGVLFVLAIAEWLIITVCFKNEA